MLVKFSRVAALFVNAVNEILALLLEKKSCTFGAFFFLRNVPGGEFAGGIFLTAVENALLSAVLDKDL